MTDVFIPKLAPKIPKEFVCLNCDYNTCNIKDYNKHLATGKHKILTDNTQNTYKNNEYSCNCGKKYKHRQSLFNHKKKCIQPNNVKDETNDLEDLEESDSETKPSSNEIISLMKMQMIENQEIRSLIIELLKKETIGNINNNNINNNNTINTNCNNKSFNLNVFLNEQCKDAMNMSEFVDTIKMQLSDLENFAHLGYADGVSKIFVQGINALEIHLRPIHCSDSKRETLYIKDNDEWIKETDDKPLIKSAIKRVAFKNIKQINEWIKENPECKDPRTKKYDKYNKIVMNAMSGTTVEEQQDNIEKIVKNVTKAVTIDKYALR